jgi:hypothetical protein
VELEDKRNTQVSVYVIHKATKFVIRYILVLGTILFLRSVAPFFLTNGELTVGLPNAVITAFRFRDGHQYPELPQKRSKIMKKISQTYVARYVL